MTDTLTSDQLDHSGARLDSAHSHGGPQQVGGGDRANRLTSFNPQDFPRPNGREEEWRFTPIDQFANIFDAPESAAAIGLTAELPEGVTIDAIDAAEARSQMVLAPGDLPAAAAFARSPQATEVTIGAGIHVETPVRITLHGDSRSDLVWDHLRIRAEAGSQATVILEHTGSAELCALVGVDVADDAHLTVVSVQDWDSDAVHVAETDIVLGKDATCKHVVVTFGGAVVRMSTNARFTAEGGDLALLGLYFTDSHQHQEHRLYVDHAEPRCRSRATYKGALQGAGAHAVWIGDVLIRAAAEGTDTYELNRNLVLTPGARADSVPNLEIETGEIEGAGHASATGRFDDEQLFYLQSRGIPESEARRLVVHGFFAELVREIGVPAVEEQLLASIEKELSATPGTESAPSEEPVR